MANLGALVHNDRSTEQSTGTLKEIVPFLSLHIFLSDEMPGIETTIVQV